jgi:membrane protease YdiL (CAAX protease family)
MSRIVVSEPRQASTPPTTSLRPYLSILVVCWVALAVAAYLFARQERAQWIISAALPAFLIESVFYLGALFEGSRLWFAERFWSWTQGGIIWVSALTPYLVLSLVAGTFQARAFLTLAGLTGVLSFWYVLAPRRPTYDLGFLIVAAGPVLLRVFQRIYIAPEPTHLRIDFLGHLMVIHVAVLALLVLRRWQPGPVGLWPNWVEWRTAFAYYLIAVAPLCIFAVSLHAVRFAPRTGPWWRLAALALGYFFGMLWVTAFSEELLFRGVVERALLNAWPSKWAAIFVSSLLYGAVHLWLGHFPNWNWVLIATVLGLFLGSAYVRTGSIRAPMVTHALVIVTWKMLFV